MADIGQFCAHILPAPLLDNVDPCQLHISAKPEYTNQICSQQTQLALMRQGRLCSININQVVLAEFQNKKNGTFFFTNCFTQVQLIEKRKTSSINDAGTMFCRAVFVRKMNPYFFGKMIFFETSKYFLIVRFLSSIMVQRGPIFWLD